MLPDWILPSALRGVTWKSLEATRLKAPAWVFTLEYRPAINDEATLQRLQCRIVDLASDARPAIHNFSTFYFRILDPVYVHLHTVVMDATPEAIRKILDELEANRRSRKSAWATLQRLRKFLEATGTRISIPEERSFETEGEAIESGLKRTIAGRDAVMRSLIQAVYRFRDAALVDEKKDDFGSALQNLYRELERAENVVGPS